MDGYRLITTTYTYITTLHEAKRLALKGRGEGKRTEIITEDDYCQHYMKPMQDLTTIEVDLFS